ALGMVCVNNQARIYRGSTVPGLGTSFGRGGATSAQQDLANADCILIEGSSMAEAHPVGFRWVMKAKERGATIIHVDPRFSRASALRDFWARIRAGGDIGFLGGIVRHIIENNLFFRDYVVHFTNASCILREDFRDTDEGEAGFFSGWDEQHRAYDKKSWAYEGHPVRTKRLRFVMRSAGRNIRKAFRSFARPRSCNCCSATSAGRVAEFWRCA